MNECLQIICGGISLGLIFLSFGIMCQLDEGKSLKEIIYGK